MSILRAHSYAEAKLWKMLNVVLFIYCGMDYVQREGAGYSLAARGSV